MTFVLLPFLCSTAFLGVVLIGRAHAAAEYAGNPSVGVAQIWFGIGSLTVAFGLAFAFGALIGGAA